MKFEIELTPQTKSLICRAEGLISSGSYWDENLSRAIEAVKHAASLGVEDFNFALAVLRTTTEDAETTIRGEA